jgi:catechol 2,3-dioxygenase-like lactoylglutathione lyase family enzyme
VSAGSDPFRDDGRSYAARLEADGVRAKHVEYAGAIHAFLNFPGALPYAWKAIDEISQFARVELGGSRPARALQHVTTLYDRGRVDELRAFYRDALGLIEKPAPAAFAAAGIIWFDAGDGERELHFVPNDDRAAIPHLCLHIDDLDDVAARLMKAGITLEHSDAIANRPRFFMQDPFDNTIEVVSIRGPYA